MEISIGDYGRMVFEMMTGKYKDMPEHWASIAKEAQPLVEQLLALNEKMLDKGYTIVGLKDKKTGKKKLSKQERIDKAQEKLLSCKASKLKEGDYFWLFKNYDIEMYIGQDDPLKVEDKTKKGIYFEMSHMGGHHTESIGLDEIVLKAPDEYQTAMKAADEAGDKVGTDLSVYPEYQELRAKADEIEDEVTSEEYWLKKADELGI